MSWWAMVLTMMPDSFGMMTLDPCRGVRVLEKSHERPLDTYAISKSVYSFKSKDPSMLGPHIKPKA